MKFPSAERHGAIHLCCLKREALHFFLCREREEHRRAVRLDARRFRLIRFHQIKDHVVKKRIVVFSLLRIDKFDLMALDVYQSIGIVYPCPIARHCLGEARQFLAQCYVPSCFQPRIRQRHLHLERGILYVCMGKRQRAQTCCPRISIVGEIELLARPRKHVKEECAVKLPRHTIGTAEETAHRAAHLTPLVCRLSIAHGIRDIRIRKSRLRMEQCVKRSMRTQLMIFLCHFLRRDAEILCADCRRDLLRQCIRPRLILCAAKALRRLWNGSLIRKEEDVEQCKEAALLIHAESSCSLVKQHAVIIRHGKEQDGQIIVGRKDGRIIHFRIARGVAGVVLPQIHLVRRIAKLIECMIELLAPTLVVRRHQLAHALDVFLRHCPSPLMHPFQNSPVITPSSVMSIPIAAGTFGSPGMVRMLPVSATTKPAPQEARSSRTVMRNPAGRPRSAGLSESEYCVFAMQTGVSVMPSVSISAICFCASGVKSTPSAP